MIWTKIIGYFHFDIFNMRQHIKQITDHIFLFTIFRCQIRGFKHIKHWTKSTDQSMLQCKTYNQLNERVYRVRIHLQGTLILGIILFSLENSRDVQCICSAFTRRISIFVDNTKNLHFSRIICLRQPNTKHKISNWS